jgi:hypothetical protein
MLKPQKVGCLPPISWWISQPSTCFHPSLQGLASSPDSKTAYSTKHRRATTAAGRGRAGTREKMSNKKEGKHGKTVKIMGISMDILKIAATIGVQHVLNQF